MDKYNVYFDNNLTYANKSFKEVIDILYEYDKDRKKKNKENLTFLGKIKVELVISDDE